VTCGKKSFRENILFTHHGLSGPAALQASLYWNPGKEILVDLLPDMDLFAELLEKKKSGSKMEMKTIISGCLSKKLAACLTELYFPKKHLPLHQIADQDLKTFAHTLKNWTLTPASTVGYDKAEVTRGGVFTDELSSKTMEAKKVSGLYFIGEVVDVTGWLGGYNFQWAWSSGWAAGQVV
jgi:hypothetical protein